MDANLVSLGVSYIYFRGAKYVLRLKKVPPQELTKFCTKHVNSCVDIVI
jgi:hypothetical protein